MKEVTPKLRKEMEAVIYKFFDTLDKTKSNSEKYKEIFSKMNNKQFTEFISADFPYRFYVKPFEVEPTIKDIEKALKVVDAPLFERVNLPYLYKNEKGKPVQSKPCLVLYVHIKKMQQFITKKNAMSTNIEKRNMKSGVLIFDDKNSKETDREMESLVINNLDYTMKELSRHRADSMDAKGSMYNQISTLGTAKLADAPVDKDDSLSKNLLNTYLLGAHIQSNLLNEGYYLPYTLKNKQKKIERI